MNITEKIDKFLVNEEKDYDYDTNLMDNIANLIENNYKKKYISWENLVKKEITKTKKTLKLKPKYWKKQLNDTIDNLEVTYDDEIYDKGGKKGDVVGWVIDTIKEYSLK